MIVKDPKFRVSLEALGVVEEGVIEAQKHKTFSSGWKTAAVVTLSVLVVLWVTVCLLIASGCSDSSARDDSVQIYPNGETPSPGGVDSSPTVTPTLPAYSTSVVTPLPYTPHPGCKIIDDTFEVCLEEVILMHEAWGDTSAPSEIHILGEAAVVDPNWKSARLCVKVGHGTIVYGMACNGGLPLQTVPFDSRVFDFDSGYSPEAFGKSATSTVWEYCVQRQDGTTTC